MARLCRYLIPVWLAAVAAAAWAVAFEAKSFEQLVAEADTIFVGTAGTATPRRLATGAIVSDVPFDVDQVFKGERSAVKALMVAGGSIGGETLELSGMPKFRPGLVYLVFVQGNGTTIFPVVGGDQGMFQVRNDAGQSFVFNFRGQPVANSSVLQATGLQAPAPIPLGTFLDAIRQRLP